MYYIKKWKFYFIQLVHIFLLILNLVIFLIIFWLLIEIFSCLTSIFLTGPNSFTSAVILLFTTRLRKVVRYGLIWHCLTLLSLRYTSINSSISIFLTAVHEFIIYLLVLVLSIGMATIPEICTCVRGGAGLLKKSSVRLRVSSDPYSFGDPGAI